MDTGPRRVLQVSGRLPPLITLYLEAPDGGFVSRPARSGSDGTFRFEVAAPLQAVGVHTLEADGTERRRQFTRDAATGGEDWHLGEVTFATEHVEVECALVLDREVAASMVRCYQRIVTADIFEGRATGPLRARCHFDLQGCIDDESARVTRQVVELLGGEGNLVVRWAGAAEDGAGPGPGLPYLTCPLPAADGARRRSVLEIGRDQVVRARVQWRDGTPREHHAISLHTAAQMWSLWTDSGGEACFFVATGGKGQMYQDRPWQSAEPDQFREVTAGELHTFCIDDLPWRLRLLDLRGAPIERYRLSIAPAFRQGRDGQMHQDDCPSELSPRLLEHPGGTACLPLSRVQAQPRIGIDIGDGRAHALAVPRRWLTAGLEHDLRLRDCLPEATLVIAAAGGAVVHGLPATAWLRLEERTETAGGLAFAIPCQSHLPWRIERLFAGTYDLELSDRDGRQIARGMVTLGAGVTDFVLPDR